MHQVNDVDPDSSATVQDLRSEKNLFGRLLRVPVVATVVYIGRTSLRFLIDLLYLRRHVASFVGSRPAVVEPSSRSHWDRSTAADRYDLQLIPTPRWKVPIACVVAMLAGVASETSFTFGRRSAIVVDRSSGDIVARFREPWITNDDTDFNRMIRSHRRDSPDNFRVRWLEGTQGSTEHSG